MKILTGTKLSQPCAQKACQPLIYYSNRFHFALVLYSQRNSGSNSKKNVLPSDNRVRHLRLYLVVSPVHRQQNRQRLSEIYLYFMHSRNKAVEKADSKLTRNFFVWRRGMGKVWKFLSLVLDITLRIVIGSQFQLHHHFVCSLIDKWGTTNENSRRTKLII